MNDIFLEFIIKIYLLYNMESAPPKTDAPTDIPMGIPVNESKPVEESKSE